MTNGRRYNEVKNRNVKTKPQNNNITEATQKHQSKTKGTEVPHKKHKTLKKHRSNTKATQNPQKSH